MAKLRNPLLSLSATGTIGGHLSFVRAGAAAVARSLSRRRANARAGIKPAPSPAQQAVRDRWAQGMAAWRLLSSQERAVWNDDAMLLHLTGYNLFMREYNPAPPINPTAPTQATYYRAGENVTSISRTLPAVAAGSTVIVCVITRYGEQINGVSDGSPYTAAGPAHVDTKGMRWRWYSRRVEQAGDVTVTASLANSYFPMIFAWVVPGLTANPAAGVMYNYSATFGTATDAITVGPLTPTAENTFQLTLAWDTTYRNTFTHGTGWTNATPPELTSYDYAYAEYRNQIADPAAYTATMTMAYAQTISVSTTAWQLGA